MLFLCVMELKRIIYTVLTLLLVPIFAEAQSGSADFIDMVSDYSNGNYISAKQKAEAIVKSEPGNDAAWYYLGLADMGLRNYAGAEKNLSEAVRLDSGNFWYGQNLAMAYAMENKVDESISQYEKLLKLFPKKSDIYYRLFTLYSYKQQYDKALGALDAIEQTFGKNDQTEMYRFSLLGQQGKTEEAYQALRDYTDEYSSTQALGILADHALDEGKDSLAIDYYDKALELDKDYAPARLGKAEAYRMTGKYQKYFPVLKGIMNDTEIPTAAKTDYLKAVLQNDHRLWRPPFLESMDTVFSEAIAAAPSDTAMAKMAGSFYYTAQMPDKMLKVFKDIIDKNPEDTSSTVTYIQVLGTLEQWDGVVGESQKAYDKFRDKVFLDMKIWGQYNSRDMKGVIQTCKTILTSSPDSASALSAYTTLGDSYHELGEKSKAYKAYDKALKVNPDYAPVLNNYAYYLSLEGKNLKKAYAMSKKTIEQEPDNATYLDTFGWILHLQGKDLEAKPMFKQAMIYGGKDSSTVMEHYATVLEKLGETDLAKVYRAQAKQKAEEEAKAEKTK